MPRIRASTSRNSAGADQVGLVDDDDVGEGDLVLRLRRVAQALAQPLGVGDGHHRVEPRRAAHVLVDEEGLGDRRRIGEAGRLDDDRVELALAPHQPFDDADQVAAHGAADAAVVHLEHFLVGADDELVVDADFAELVDDHGVALAVRLGEDAVEQGRLAGAEIAGQHGDGDLVEGRVGHGVQALELRTSWGKRRSPGYRSPPRRWVGAAVTTPDRNLRRRGAAAAGRRRRSPPARPSPSSRCCHRRSLPGQGTFAALRGSAPADGQAGKRRSSTMSDVTMLQFETVRSVASSLIGIALALLCIVATSKS